MEKNGKKINPETHNPKYKRSVYDGPLSDQIIAFPFVASFCMLFAMFVMRFVDMVYRWITGNDANDGLLMLIFAGVTITGLHVYFNYKPLTNTLIFLTILFLLFPWNSIT